MDVEFQETPEDGLGMVLAICGDSKRVWYREVVAALVKNPILHRKIRRTFYSKSILFSFFSPHRYKYTTSFSLGNIKHIFAKINIVFHNEYKSSNFDRRRLGDLRDDPIRDPVIDTIYEGADYPHNEYFVGYNTVFSSAITQFVWFGTGMVTFLINKDIVNTVLILPRTWIIIKNLEEDLQAYSNKLSTHFSRLLPFWSKRMQSG
ncbi:hypothetical protein ACJX0J_004114 (mitochondrion) [Zea mays]